MHVLHDLFLGQGRPRLTTTKTLIDSPDFSSGMPIAAHCRTPGRVASTSSSSFGKH